MREIAVSMLIAGAGVLAYEIFRIYELMGKLPASKFRSLFSAPFYWPITLAFILGSSYVSWAINSSGDPTPWQLIVAAIGARSIVAKPFEISLGRNTEPSLGGSPPQLAQKTTGPSRRAALRDMFS
jgi:hypothetical protein